MKFFKQKLVVLSPLLVLTVALIFSLTLVPSINPTLKNMPIAIVNEDEGVEIPKQGKLNMGNVLVEKVQSMSKEDSNEEPIINWVSVSDRDTLMEGLNNKEYYAALIIPNDFSQNQASLQTPKPSSPNIEILINEGMNATVARMAGQMLSGITENFSHNLSMQLLAGFEKQGENISPKQAALLVDPLTVTVTNVNAVGTHSANGNAPVLFIQPLWMSSIVGAAIVFFSIKKMKIVNRRASILSKLTQIFSGALLSFIVGFGLTGILDSWLGFHIPMFIDTALFVSLSYLTFFLLISAVTNWLGFKGIGVFALLFFFGIPLLSMPPEFMSAFYRDWIHSWLPMRFSVEGLRNLLYFGKFLSFDSPTLALFNISWISLLIIFVSAFKPKPENEQGTVK
ncbi:YhgE/Pip domain-containing protein [Paenisporosarcina sp. TG-14]|uniref:YhgE/Pip domain-containing protein n=1 Tax=Paenisporosarcina sp. TG-14 TaxID=1231057 RepID=UPI000316048E|nr:ABC transporter permease [Paenisporosarcina sp. TG-14]